MKSNKIQTKRSDLKKIRLELLKKQNNRCYLCRVEFDLENKPKDCHVHHNHTTGLILCCLCRRCNVQESKWLNGYKRNTKRELKSERDFFKITKDLYKLYTIEPTNYLYPSTVRKKRKRKAKRK